MAIANDTFVESSDTILTSHTPTGSNAGTSWAAMFGAGQVTILGGTGQATDTNSSNGNRSKMSPDLGYGEMDVSADFTTNGTSGEFVFFGLIFRIKNDDTEYGEFRFTFGSGSPSRYELWNGTTQVMVDEAWGSGTKTFKVEVRNAGVTAFVNGSQKLQILAENIFPNNQMAGFFLGNFTGSTNRSTVANYQSQGIPPAVEMKRKGGFFASNL